jgi:hypothetical protein
VDDRQETVISEADFARKIRKIEQCLIPDEWTVIKSWCRDGGCINWRKFVDALRNPEPDCQRLARNVQQTPDPRKHFSSAMHEIAWGLKRRGTESMDRLDGVIETSFFRNIISNIAHLSDDQFNAIKLLVGGVDGVDGVDITRFRAELTPLSKEIDDQWTRATMHLSQVIQNQPGFIFELSSVCDEAGTAEKNVFGTIAKTHGLEEQVIEMCIYMWEVESSNRMHCRKFLPMPPVPPTDSTVPKDTNPPPKVTSRSVFLRSLREAARSRQPHDPPSKGFRITQSYTKQTFGQTVEAIRGKSMDETEWEEMKDRYHWRNNKPFDIKQFCDDLDRAE